MLISEQLDGNINYVFVLNLNEDFVLFMDRHLCFSVSKPDKFFWERNKKKKANFLKYFFINFQ